jgi:hypothetical protein
MIQEIIASSEVQDKTIKDLLSIEGKADDKKSKNIYDGIYILFSSDFKQKICIKSGKNIDECDTILNQEEIEKIRQILSINIFIDANKAIVLGKGKTITSILPNTLTVKASSFYNIFKEDNGSFEKYFEWFLQREDNQEKVEKILLFRQSILDFKDSSILDEILNKDGIKSDIKLYFIFIDEQFDEFKYYEKYLREKIPNKNGFSIVIDGKPYIANSSIGSTFNQKKPFLKRFGEDVKYLIPLDDAVKMEVLKARRGMENDFFSLEYKKQDDIIRFSPEFFLKNISKNKFKIEDYIIVHIRPKKENEKEYEVFKKDKECDADVLKRELERLFWEEKDDEWSKDKHSFLKGLAATLIEGKKISFHYINFIENKYNKILNSIIAKKQIGNSQKFHISEMLNLKYSIFEKTKYKTKERMMNSRDLHKNTVDKIVKNEPLTTEEFFFLAGQVIKFLIGKKAGNNKNWDEATFLLKGNVKHLKEEIKKLFMAYSHSIETFAIGFNLSFTKLLEYKSEEKLVGQNLDYLLMGLLTGLDNVVYTVGKKMKEENENIKNKIEGDDNE